MSIRDKAMAYAYNNASKLGLDFSMIDILSDIAFCALGLDLFDKPFFCKTPITRELEIAHPLVNALHVDNSIDFGVVELLELGLYLKEFSSDSNIHICINNLKNAKQYESTLLQLAFAYRLKIAGCKILLEPQTLRGRSDILFTYETGQYIAECYRINRSFLDFVGDFYIKLFKALMNYVPEGKKYYFKIRFQEHLSPENKVKILQKFKKMISKISKDESISMEDEFENIYIGIEDITNVFPDPHFEVRGIDAVRRMGYADADACLCKTSVYASSAFSVSEIPSSASTRMSRLFIWGKDAMELSSPLRILESKINNKLKQTKVEDTTVGRLLVVEMPFTRGFKKNNNKILEIQNRIVRLYKSISALVILARLPSSNHRFFYEGPFVMGYSEHALPEKLIRRLSEIEKVDILK